MSFNFIWLGVSMVMIFTIFLFSIISRDVSEYIILLQEYRFEYQTTDNYYLE